MTYTLYYDFETQDDGISSGIGPGWCFDMSEILCMGYAIDDGPTLCTNDRGEMIKLITGADTLIGYNIEYEFGNTKYDLGVEFKWKKAFDVFVGAKLFQNVEPANYKKKVSRWGYSLDVQSQYYLKVKGSDKKATTALVREALRLGIISPTVDTKMKKDGTMGKRKQSDRALKNDMYATLGQLYGQSPEIVEDYCKIDVELTRDLHKFFLAEGLDEDIYKLYSQLPKVLVEMRKKGIRVDVDRAMTLKTRYTQEAEGLTKLCHAQMGQEVNFRSPKQLMDYAIENKVELKEDSTKASGYTFDDSWLQMIAPNYEWAATLAKAKTTLKFIKTYLEPIIEKSVAGRLHMNLNLLEARTGRFSSSDPNLQNLPNAYTVQGEEIRSLFLADEGKEFKCLDFSGQEFRIMLHLGKLLKEEGAKFKRPTKLKYEDYKNLTYKQREEAKENHGHLLEREWSTIDDPLIDTMIQGYVDDPEYDCHTVNRKSIFNASGLEMFSEENAKEGRNVTKTVTYGKMYGQQAAGLSKKQGCDMETAQKILDSFDEGVPFIKDISDYLTYVALKRGYCRSITGRIFRFTKPLYKFLNYVIQGSAFDQCALAMIQAYHVGVIPSMQVHDEMSSGDWSDEEAETMSFIMENAVKLYIPSLAEIGTGPSWSQAK